MRLEEFAMVMKELFELSYTQFFQSLNLELQLTEAAWKHLLGAEGCPALLREECRHVHAFQSLRQLPLPERERIFHTLLESVTAAVAKQMAAEVMAAAEYEAEHNEEPGRFAGMVLGDALCFDCGIDVLGLPDLDFERGISREHASHTTFSAWNNDEQRHTTPAEQLAKALPGGWAGPINNKDYHGRVMCEAGFEQHPMALKAGLQKCELVMLRLYSGPMFAQYNGKMRAFLRCVQEILPKERKGLGPALVMAAMEAARKRMGSEYVTSILVLVSALLKLRTVCPLPPGRKVFRGFAGLETPQCFKFQDDRGNQGGVEFGFLSTSTCEQQAIGYIAFDKGMPQLYEMDLGQIDRGADLSWISYFPGEAEVLLPPLSSLEATGAARFKNVLWRDAAGETSLRKVMVWPVRVNVNLQGKTVEQHQGNRKRLHAQMADNALAELTAFIEREQQAAAGAAAEQGAGTEEERLVLLETARAQSEAVAAAYRECGDAQFNNDRLYSTAIQDVVTLFSWAQGLLDLAEEARVPAAELQALQLKQYLPSARPSSSATSAAALFIAKEKELVKEYIDERGAFTDDMPLHTSAAQGDHEAVALLLLGGASIDSQDSNGSSALMLALENKHENVAQMLLDKGAKIDIKNSAGDDALINACKWELNTMAEKLLDSRADVNASNESGETPLILACGGQGTGAEALAAKLLDARADIHAKNSDGCTALWFACGGLCCRSSDPPKEHTVAKLIEAGADVNAANDRGESPLQTACCLGYDGLAVQLLAARADANAVDTYGRTVLIEALASNVDSAATVAALLAARADLLATEPTNGRSALMVASESKKQRAVAQLLLAGAAPDDKDELGLSALALASSQGSEEVVAELIKAGAAVNVADAQGVSPLMHACRAGSEAVGRRLVEARADVNAVSESGSTALGVACAGKREALVALLLEARADVNVGGVEGPPLLSCCVKGLEAVVTRMLAAQANPSCCDADGVSCLMAATKKGHVRIVDQLLEAGAEINTADKQGSTALFRAIELNSEAIANKLVDSRADVVSENKDKLSPLLVATQADNPSIVGKLLAAGAPVDAADKKGFTALIWACSSGRTKVASTLLEEGANVNATDTQGLTALMWACREEQEDCVTLLLEKGADMNAADAKGLTALMWACSNNNEAIASLLLEGGADVNAKNKAGETALSLSNDEDLQKLLRGKGATA